MAETIAQIIERIREDIADHEAVRDLHTQRIRDVTAQLTREQRHSTTAAESARVDEARTAAGVESRAIQSLQAKLAEWEREAAADAEVDRLATGNIPTEAGLRYGGAETFERNAAGGQVHRGGRSGVRWTRQDGRSAVVERSQRFSDHPVVAAYANQRTQAERPVLEGHGNLSNLIRSMSTVSGSAIVPTIWASDIIDRARNYAAVIKAGAEIIPMDAKTVQIGRLTADPSAGFRTEGSLVTASDPTFDNVTLTANTLSCLVIGSLEWFQDAIDVENVVSEAIAKAVALELDLNALYGGLAAGSEIGATGFNRTLTAPPSPRGILAALLAVKPGNVLGSGATGTTQTAGTFWNEVIQTIVQPTYLNEAPNALLWSPQTAAKYAMSYDTLGQPLRQPDVVSGIQKYVTNQIPSNMTVGTSTANMSDLFAGDFTQLLIGQRLDFQIQTLTERYAELGQIGILATWRGDVQPARPGAFSCYRYLKNT